MQYIFDIDDAVDYGVDEAIMLYNFKFWINKNIANSKNYFDGRYWTYNSINAFSKLFPFWSKKQIIRILNSLIKKGVLITGNYNKIGYDRTKWYALMDESILLNSQNELTKRANGIDQTVEPIPDNKPDVNTDEYRTTEYFINKLLEEIKPPTYKNRKPNIDKWIIHIKRLNEVDGIKYSDIIKVIDWTVKDDFWKTNILSTEKLRKQFNKLFLAMNKDKFNNLPNYMRG